MIVYDYKAVGLALNRMYADTWWEARKPEVREPESPERRNIDLGTASGPTEAIEVAVVDYGFLTYTAVDGKKYKLTGKLEI